MKTIWLDCDPGHDDAMAIILACFHPDCFLLGVSTVAGNQSVEKTTLNAAAILATIGRSDIIPIRGQARALMQPLKFCAEIHGTSGLDGPGGKTLFRPVDIPEQNEPGVLIIYLKIRSHFLATGETIDLVCTGSLTNAALLITLFPDVAQMIRITIMGGAIGVGNTGPVAEFNIENDPEAARIVFECGLPLVMVPLEVTHTALVTSDILQKIGTQTQFRNCITEMLTYFKTTYKEVFDFEDPPLHDPLAVWYVLKPAFFKTQFFHVGIETASVLSKGQTVCDIYNRTGKAPNCTVALSADIQAFWNDMLLAVDRANEVAD